MTLIHERMFEYGQILPEVGDPTGEVGFCQLPRLLLFDGIRRNGGTDGYDAWHSVASSWRQELDPTTSPTVQTRRNGNGVQVLQSEAVDDTPKAVPDLVGYDTKLIVLHLPHGRDGIHSGNLHLSAVRNL